MNYDFQYIDRDKLQLVINKVTDKRSMLTPLVNAYSSRVKSQPQSTSASSFDDDENDEFYEDECALTSDVLVAPQMVTYRKEITPMISIDSMNLTSEAVGSESTKNPKSVRVEKPSAANTSKTEKPIPIQHQAVEKNYLESIHTLQEEIGRDIDQLIIKITEKKYLFNQKPAFGTSAKQACKHTKSFCDDYLNRIQEVYKQMSAREPTSQNFELKLFAQCHHSILKGLKAFERYFNNAFNNSSIANLSILLIYAEKMTTKFMKCIITAVDPKYFETTSILSRKLLRVIDIIDDLKKRSSERNRKKCDKPSKKSLDVYGGGGKVAVKRKIVKKVSVDVSKTKMTKSKPKPGQTKAIKRETVTISEEKTVQIAVAENVPVKVEHDEWRKQSLLLIEELDEVANKCSETCGFINKNQLIESLRYFAKKFTGQPMDSADGFPSILSSSRTCSQTELPPNAPSAEKIDESDKKSSTPLPESVRGSDIDMKSKSLTCEEIFRPTKNVQLLYLRSQSLERTNSVDGDKQIQVRNVSLDEMIGQRNKFVASLRKKSMYKNKHFGRPWSVLSIISDNIMAETIESILSQLKSKDAHQ